MPAGPDSGELRLAGGTSVALYPKLKPGPGLSSELVLANQGARLRGAMIELAAEQGFARVTVRGLARLAGVSTKTFYDCFANVDDCFRSTYLWVVRSILRRAMAAGGDDDETRIRSRVAAIFSFLAENPKAARFLLLEAVSAGRDVGDGPRSSLMLERLLGEALSSDAPLGSHRSVMSRAAIAAGIRIARAHLLAGQHDRLPELTKPFSDWLSALRNGEPSLEARSPRRGGSVGDRDHLSRRLAVSAGDDRQLLLVAATKLVLREGYAALTAPAIRREAGVSRRIFEQYFEGHADCFLTAVDSLIFEAFDRAEKEAAAARSWDRRVARTLEHLMAGLAHQPAMARLVLVEMLRPGICGLMRREDIVRRLAERLQGAAPAGARLGHVSAEASVAGAWHIAEMQVADGRVDRLRDLTGRMAYVVLAPTIGAGAAERAILSVAGNTRA